MTGRNSSDSVYGTLVRRKMPARLCCRAASPNLGEFAASRMTRAEAGAPPAPASIINQPAPPQPRNPKQTQSPSPKEPLWSHQKGSVTAIPNGKKSTGKLAQASRFLLTQSPISYIMLTRKSGTIFHLWIACGSILGRLRPSTSSPLLLPASFCPSQLCQFVVDVLLDEPGISADDAPPVHEDGWRAPDI